MTVDDVLDRFSCPPDHHDSSLPTTLKPNVLFLYEVKYNEEHFLNPPIFKSENSIVDNIDNVMMEVQEYDDEDDQQLNSKMMSAR
jgi:hypothetical protein